MQTPYKKSFLLNNSVKTFLLFTLGFFPLSANHPSFLFFSDIEFRVVENGESDHHYVWIHGDEKTAEMALNSHMKHYPGKAFFIKSEEREVFVSGVMVDPNRMFSRKGAASALRKFKTDWETSALTASLDRLDEDREKFLEKLLPKNGGLLIAVHNNFRGYNVNRELPISRIASIKEDQNPRDFILCTSEADYLKLAGGPFNVILQDELSQDGNGSLSWAALRNGVRYINIETRLGWLSQQKKMLKFAEESLRNSGLNQESAADVSGGGGLDPQ